MSCQMAPQPYETRFGGTDLIQNVSYSKEFVYVAHMYPHMLKEMSRSKMARSVLV